MSKVSRIERARTGWERDEARRNRRWYAGAALAAVLMILAVLTMSSAGCDLPPEMTAKFLVRAGVTPPPGHDLRSLKERTGVDFIFEWTRFCDVPPLPRP